LGYDVVEWRSPLGFEYATQEYTPFHAQFDDFLARSNKFGGLELNNSLDADQKAMTQTSPMRRIILIEEFPGTVSQASLAVTAFRASLLRYLASSASAERTNSPQNGDPSPPIVIIVTETLLNTAAAVSDNFTVQRLLGTELCNHPDTTVIEFNRIAPTFMFKALDLVLKKARYSKRRTPGAPVLKKYSELGDIRSAISALEFLCLREDEERKSLEMVTQREASLGIFHAVGKIMYNKREDGSPIQKTKERACLPENLRQPARISQVSVDDLINETGTDVQTFISALHENYVPSCDGPSFTDCFDKCIQALSESDALASDSRSRFQTCRTGVGTARVLHQDYGASVDRIRQDEISFHVAARGLLFSLPYPVKRRLGYRKNGGRNAHKMYFPVSLRLWKESEQLEGLIDYWQGRLLDPTTAIGAIGSGPDSVSRPEGVASWKSRDVNESTVVPTSDPEMNSTIVTRISREDMLLQRFPYMTRILGSKTDMRDLERITQFPQMNAQTNEILDDDLDHFENASSEPWDIDHGLPDTQRQKSGHLRPIKDGTSGQKFTPSLEKAAERLILSDDDIEDD
jgi:cell cycle checkpoint protein